MYALWCLHLRSIANWFEVHVCCLTVSGCLADLSLGLVFDFTSIVHCQNYLLVAKVKCEHCGLCALTV